MPARRSGASRIGRNSRDRLRLLDDRIEARRIVHRQGDDTREESLEVVVLRAGKPSCPSV